MDTRITLEGRLAGTPELRTHNNTPYISVGLLVAPRFRAASGQFWYGEPIHHWIKASGVLATNAACSLKRDDTVIVVGTQRSEMHSQNGVHGSSSSSRRA
jgi:single-stranded DNA-binding protein